MLKAGGDDAVNCHMYAGLYCLWSIFINQCLL